MEAGSPRRTSSYLGDVTALALLPRRGGSGAGAQRVLVGSGAHLRVYRLPPSWSPADGAAEGERDLGAGTGDAGLGLELDERVLDGGARVHGVRVVGGAGAGEDGWTLLAFGERQCRELRLSAGTKMALRRGRRVGRLSGSPWVLDAALLGDGAIAVGCSDNSVRVWGGQPAGWLRAAHCAERCLLYSMHLAAAAPDGGLWVAAGTIFHEILVWRTPAGDGASVSAPPLHRLWGHAGSVYRVTWLRPGARLLSASDDRSARLWARRGSGVENDGGGGWESERTVFGHGARVWDGAMLGEALVTVSEDCTCRVWDAAGRQLGALRGHRGKGIWRVCADEQAGLLVTAGADSSVKVWRAASHVFAGLGSVAEFPAGRDALVLSGDAPPDPGSTTGKALSRGLESLGRRTRTKYGQEDWVRCMELLDARTLLLATNRGRVHRVGLAGPTGEESWSTVYATAGAAPLFALRACAEGDVSGDGAAFDVDAAPILAGDRAGHAYVFTCDGATDLAWLAHPGMPVLSAFWCLGPGRPVTADRAGAIKIWQLNREEDAGESGPRCVGSAASPFGMRILSMARSPGAGPAVFLYCGDQKGNVLAFRHDGAGLALAAVLEKQHGSDAVCLVQATAGGAVSAGRDALLYSYDRRLAATTGCEKLQTITALEARVVDAAGRQILAGFQADDFVVWDATASCVLFRVPCGGWRRVHAFHLRHGGEMALAYAQGRDIVVHRLLRRSCTASGPSFHGRAVHAARLIPLPRLPGAAARYAVATCGEDGLLHLALYDAGTRRLAAQALAGQSVGGAALKSLALAPVAGGGDGRWVLVAGGAKEVLVAWSLAAAGDGVACELLSVKVPRGGLRPRSEAQVRTDHDHRVLAVQVLPAPGPALFVAVASADTSLRVLRLDPAASPAWRPECVLRHHETPVLALAALPGGPGAGATVTLASGGTDGTVALWALPAAGGGGAVLRPVQVFRRLHQSGVNCLHLARAAAGGGVFLASGGDDQAISCLHLESAGADPQAAYHQAHAHSSAVTGVWSDGAGLVLSSGLDQRVCRWELGAQSLDLVACFTQDVGDIAALDAWKDGEEVVTCTAGRGVQVDAHA